MQGMRKPPRGKPGILLIEAGRKLCEHLLEPLAGNLRPAWQTAQRRNGSPEVNGFGNAHNLSCAQTSADSCTDIWGSKRDAEGGMGAMTTHRDPWLAGSSRDRYPLAVHGLGGFTIICPTASCVFPKTLRLQNNACTRKPEKRPNPSRLYPHGGLLTHRGAANPLGWTQSHYPGFPGAGCPANLNLERPWPQIYAQFLSVILAKPRRPRDHSTRPAQILAGGCFWGVQVTWCGRAWRA